MFLLSAIQDVGQESTKIPLLALESAFFTPESKQFVSVRCPRPAPPHNKPWSVLAPYDSMILPCIVDRRRQFTKALYPTDTVTEGE